MRNSKAIRHVWALDTATMNVDCSILQVGTGGQDVEIPLPSILIEHEQGLLMYDFGLASDAAGDPVAVYGEMATYFGMKFPSENRLDRQLETLGFKTMDVKRVVLSHSHFDHTGGLDLFPGAQGFVGEAELRYARTPAKFDELFFRQEDVDAAAKINWNEVPADYDHDVFGDGSVVIMSLQGHTLGHLGLKVQLPERTIIFTGDAAHRHTNIDITVGMPYDVLSHEKFNALRRLKLLRTQPHTTVWVNHDPEDWAKHRPRGREIYSADSYSY